MAMSSKMSPLEYGQNILSNLEALRILIDPKLTATQKSEQVEELLGTGNQAKILGRTLVYINIYLLGYLSQCYKLELPEYMEKLKESLLQANPEANGITRVRAGRPTRLPALHGDSWNYSRARGALSPFVLVCEYG